MRGDFSRVSFRPENHFSGVLLQQGRVQVDAEFNEHVDIEAYRDQATARDVIGPAGAPQDGGGFAIAVAAMLRGIAAGTNAWAVGEDATMLRSEGGAAPWTLEAVPVTGSLNAIDVKNDVGWAVGDGAAIVRLEAGAWTAVPAPAKVTAELHGVYLDPKGFAWAVGAAGTVLSWDGSSWQRRAENADVVANLRDVDFTGTFGVAVGDDGTILVTKNRGADWILQMAPEGSGDLHGVAVVDAKHAWAVGAQGTVLVFDGTDWTRQPVSPRVTSTLRAVAFAGATEGTAVGDGGTALRFSGGTWQSEPTGVDADLLALTTAADGSLLAAGGDVTIGRAAPGQAWTQALRLPASGRTLTISPGGIYVEGVRCENERPVALDRQPEPPYHATAFPPAKGTYGVFLIVQEQHLTATEREQLREVALGGPDTATRTRTVWQAGLVKLAGAEATCADVLAAGPHDPPRGRLRARAVPATVSTSECIVPPNGGYRRLENQLYRVEIHAGTTAGATYTWSRDNGSVIARLEGLTTNTANKTGAATVSHTGRDAVVGFGPDQLVELTDEGRMLRSEPGVLAQIDTIEGRTLLLSGLDKTPLTMADFPLNPIVRRWDGHGPVQPGTWTELEDGVFVEFAEGPDPADAFRTGDYWTIPARTLTGEVEWPQTGNIPCFEERHGPRRHTAPLAIANVDGDGVWSDVRDCRKRFPPLTDLVYMYYVGGDGQEIMPPTPLETTNVVPLDRPLQVGVANGGTPMAGAIVDFEVKVGGGKVLAPGGAAADAAPIVTDDDGIATCEWLVDGATRTQVVEARFPDPLGQSPPQVVSFNAQLSAAAWVAYDGSGCTTLADSKTVEAALDTLSRLTRIFPLSASGEDVLPGESIDVKVLVTDECGPVEGATVAFERGDRGSGTVDEAQATTANGVAGCRWTPDGDTPTQDLVARLTDVPKGVLHVPDSTRFVANLNLARDTAYTPPEPCPAMNGAGTVQDAITRLAGLLPRLYHVSGDGLEGPVGATIPLRVGVANVCGIRDPQVRFEWLTAEVRRRVRTWSELGTVAPDGDGIAELAYQVTDEVRQSLRALLLSEGEPMGYPVYFTISPQQTQSDGLVPAARLRADDKQVAENGRPTIVAFSAAEFDTDNMFDPGDPTAVRATRPGTYLVTGEVEWDEQTNGRGSRGVEIMLRGGTAAHVLNTPLPHGLFTIQEVTTIVRMDNSDVVQLAATQSSGEPLTITGASLSLAWLGP